MARYSKSYQTKAEYETRVAYFRESVAMIEEANAREGVSYKLGVNKFADMSREERRAVASGVKKVPRQNATGGSENDFAQYPRSVDWRLKGGVNPVLDQGTCNSCWAFATTAAMEGAHFAAHGELKKLSEQMMIDCCYGDDCGGRDQGCHHGGCIHCALEWMQDHPQVLETDYPYIEAANVTEVICRREQYPAQASAKNVTIIDENSVSQMIEGLLQVPIAVGVDSETDYFMFYSSGIFNDVRCGVDVDHAVLAVGYVLPDVMEDQVGYWIIKNSFG
jgi:cathepsin L